MIARAFFRDARLVILDEPSSSLDADTEYQLFMNFKKLIAGKSAQIISHRFSTVKMADRILVLENGTIIESGSHQELISNGGKYAEMYAKQFAWVNRRPGSQKLVVMRHFPVERVFQTTAEVVWKCGR